MNNVSLFGAIDSEPELGGMPGRDVCELWLEVPDGRKEFTLHVKVIAFRALAEQAAARLRKGDWVAVGGYLRSQSWPGETSRRRLYEHTLIARHIDFGAVATGSDGSGDS